MKLFLLLLVTLLGASHASKCKDCISKGNKYFVSNDNQISCENVASVGQKSSKFIAESILECEILMSVMDMIGAAEEATTFFPTSKSNSMTHELSDSTSKPIITTEQPPASTSNPTTTTDLNNLEELIERHEEDDGTKTTPEPVTTTTLDESLETTTMANNRTKIRGRRYKGRIEDAINATQLPYNVMESFDSYIYRAEKNLKRIQLMFHRQIKKLLPRTKSNRTVV